MSDASAPKVLMPTPPSTSRATDDRSIDVHLITRRQRANTLGGPRTGRAHGQASSRDRLHLAAFHREQPPLRRRQSHLTRPTTHVI